MRSALAGVPVLTPEWVEACLVAGSVVAPTGTMCIRSLPRKQGGGGKDGQFCVAKYAAELHKSGGDVPAESAQILDGVKVMLCGSNTKLLTVLGALLKQTGASIIVSISSANQALDDKQPVVFICDGATNDRDCGISELHVRQARDFVDAGGAVTVVRYDWLSDSVSCVSALPAGLYEPSAPRARDLCQSLARAARFSRRDSEGIDEDSDQSLAPKSVSNVNDSTYDDDAR